MYIFLINFNYILFSFVFFSLILFSFYFSNTYSSKYCIGLIHRNIKVEKFKENGQRKTTQKMPQLFLQNIAGVQIFLLHKKLYLISLHWQQASIPTGLMLCGPWSGPSLLSKALYEPISVSILGLFLVQTNAQVFSLNISQDHSKNHFKKKRLVHVTCIFYNDIA